MSRPIGCTTANWQAIRIVLTGKALHHRGLGVPFLARNFAKAGLGETDAGRETRVGWKMDRGAPNSAVCLGNRIDQQRGSSHSLGAALVLTSRSPRVARGDAPVNHPTPTSSSPCGYIFRGLMKTIWASSCAALCTSSSISRPWHPSISLA